MPGWINVPVKIETRNRLDVVKHDSQSYDKIINELLDKVEALSPLPQQQKDDKPLDK